MGADIVIICGAGYVSGKEIVAAELVNGLSQRGERVHVVVSKWHDGGFLARLGPIQSATVLPIGFISATPQWKYQRMNAVQLLHMPALLARYSRLLARTRPGRVVHTNWHHLLLLLPLLRSTDLFWMHEIVPASRRYRLLFRLLARRLEAFICVSHAVAASLEGLGIAREKIRVVHNGVHIAAPMTNRGAGAGDVRIGIAGQVAPWKGHEDLVEAFGMLAQGTPGARLAIFGTGDPEFVGKLKARASALRIDANMDWMGFVNERDRIYGAMDICVVPSRSADPLPTTAIEAGGYGLPVVATRMGGLPEIIEDGVTGLLVDTMSPGSLAAALQRLIRDPGLRLSLGAGARARVASEFSRDRFVGEFQRLLAPAAAKGDRA